MGPTLDRTSARRPARYLARLSCTILIGLFLTVSVGGVRAAGSWQIQNPRSPSLYLHDLACPTESACYAAGFCQDSYQVILATSDGARNWWVKLRIGFPALPLHLACADVACPSARVCYMTVTICRSGQCRSSLARTVDGDAHWRAWQPARLATGGFRLACPTVAVCYASGSTGVLRTVDAGRSWRATGKMSGYVEDLVCPGAHVCFGATGYSGMILVTHNGGSSWQTQTAGTANSLHAIACPSLRSCYGVGDSGTIVGTPNGGR